MTRSELIAKDLLKIKAVFFRPNEPFTWASGIKSPIYCDNRLTLTDVAVRTDVENGLAELVKEEYPEAEVLMGTSTAGIAHAAITAQILGMPMGYVRTGSKDHGRKNQIEGKLEKGQKVVVVEDLISTAGSCVDVVNVLREAGAEEIYADAFTGTKKHRPQLDKLLKVIQNGDKVVVTKLDRIARSATQGIALIDMMLDKGVTVHILNMGIMDNTPTGRLIRTIMLAFAEFERDMIVERTQEGKAIAKQKDDFKEGRPRISKIKIDHALSLLDEGYSYKQVERMTGISTATLARRKRERLLEEDS